MATPSPQDLYDLGRATLQFRRPELLVEEGDVTDAELWGTVAMATAVLAQTETNYKKTFLDGNSGDDLTERCRDRGVERDTGSKSIGYVTLSRPNSLAGGGTLSAGFKIGAQPDGTGQPAPEFTLDQDVVFGGADLVKTNCPATCTKVGKAGNVGPDSIKRIMGNSFDGSITVMNADRFVGGRPAKSDPDLIDQTRGFFLTQARGTIDALKEGAKEVTGVDRVSVVVDDSGIVNVYVADEDGNSNAAMAAAVTTELESWRDAADVVYVNAGILTYVTIQLLISVRSGVDINALLDKIRAAVISAIGRLNPGETLYKDLIQTAAKNVAPDSIVTVDVVAPAVSIVPAANESLRTDLPYISFS